MPYGPNKDHEWLFGFINEEYNFWPLNDVSASLTSDTIGGRVIWLC